MAKPLMRQLANLVEDTIRHEDDPAREEKNLETFLDLVKPAVRQFIDDEQSGAKAHHLEQFAIYLFYHS